MRIGRDRRGIATIWFAIVGLVLVGMFSYTIDFARVRLVHQQLQAAADAAAIAAAQIVTQDQTGARTAAVRVAGRNQINNTENIQIDPNGPNNPDGDVVVGVFDSTTRTFTATTQNPNAVKVNARRTRGSIGGTWKTMFGKFWGTPESSITGTAIALAPVQGPPGIVLLDPSANGALTMTADGSLNVVGGTIQVDSSSGSAVTVTGNGVINANAVNVFGGVVQTGSAIVNNVHTGAPYMPDPLAGLGTPDLSGVTTYDDYSKLDGPLVGTGTLKLHPGIYPTKLVVAGNVTVQLTQGIYIFGDGIDVSGTSSIQGLVGAMLYAVQGAISLTGTGGIHLTSLPSGQYGQFAGISIYMDRKNPSTVTLMGEGGASVQTIYAPTNQVTLTGNSSVSSLGIVTLIANTARIQGAGNVTVSATVAGGGTTPTSLVN